MLRTMNGALETPNAQLNMLRTIVLFGLPDDYVKQQRKHAENVYARPGENRDRKVPGTSTT